MIGKGIGCGGFFANFEGWRAIVLGGCLLLGLAGAWSPAAEAEEAARTARTAQTAQRAQTAQTAQPDPTTVILVRHAEKAAEPRRDPPLTAQGEARARWLGEVLSRAGVTRVYSTDTLRTRSTAALVAEPLGLEVTVLPPRDLEAMAAALRSHRGEVVVSVGHSNTLGPLAELLGAEPLAPISEDDYEGFYILSLGGEGSSALALRLSMPARESSAARPQSMR